MIDEHKELWYCWIGGSFIVCRNIQGLLIRGIPEAQIFTVNAISKQEAHNIAYQMIQQYLKAKEQNEFDLNV